MLKLLRNDSPAGAEPRMRQDALARLAARARRGETDAVRAFVLAVGPALLRVIRRMLGADHPDVEDLTQEAAFDVIEALGRREATALVRHLVASLPEPQAAALALHCMLGHTVAEIAACTAVSPETVRSRPRLAKPALCRRVAGLLALRETTKGAS